MSSAVAKGWSNYPLSDICFFQEGPGLRNWQYRNEGVKFINIRCIQGGDIDTSVAQHLSVDEVEEKYKHFLLDEGDYVLSSSGTIGRLALVKKHHLPLLLNTSVIRFRSIDEKKLDKLFLRHFLQSKQFFDKISEQSQGSAQVNFGPTHLKLLDVLLPPLPEQKKIASILTSVDEVIETTQKQIDKLQDLKKATMNELLTKGIGHTEFKDSVLGRIPKSWDVRSLSEVSELSRGKFSHRPRNDPAFYDGDFPFLQTGDIPTDNLDIAYSSQSLNNKGLQVSRLFPKGTLVITIAATVGEVAFLTFDSCFPDSLVGITTNESVVRQYFLLFCLRFRKQVLIQEAPESAQKNLNLDILNPFQVAVPPLDEQRVIESTLLSIQKHIEKKKAKLSQTQSLKKSLMQDLLTGKVRVQVN